MDEPINGLDYESTKFLYHQIQEYRTYGTILFSSHILENICLTSDRVLVLNHGIIEQEFQKDQINTEQIREVLHEN